MLVGIANDLSRGKQFFARGDDEIQIEILLTETRDRVVVEIENGAIFRFFPIARQLFDALRRDDCTVERAYRRARDCMKRITFFRECDQRAKLISTFDAAAFENQTDAF